MEHRLSALLQLHIHSQLNTWLQWIGQRQLQDETRTIYVLELSGSYIRQLTVNNLGAIGGLRTRNLNPWPDVEAKSPFVLGMEATGLFHENNESHCESLCVKERKNNNDMIVSS